MATPCSPVRWVWASSQTQTRPIRHESAVATVVRVRSQCCGRVAVFGRVKECPPAAASLPLPFGCSRVGRSVGSRAAACLSVSLLRMATKKEKVRGARFLGQKPSPCIHDTQEVEIRNLSMVGVGFVRSMLLLIEGCRRVWLAVFQPPSLTPRRCLHSFEEASTASHLSTHQPSNHVLPCSRDGTKGQRACTMRQTRMHTAVAERASGDRGQGRVRTRHPARADRASGRVASGVTVRLRPRLLCRPRHHRARQGTGWRRATCGRAAMASVAQ